MIKKSLLFTLVFCSVGLAGCASDLTSNVYSQSEARAVQTIQEGTIIELVPVTIEGSQSGLGGIAGGAVGGLGAGSQIGGGSGSSIAAIGGAVLGGYLGNLAEEKLTRKQGVNITIRLNNGHLISVVQEVDPNMLYQVGGHVRIYEQGGTSRVVQM